MPLVLKDRVKETTTTTGTGTITLAGAVSGYQSFSVIGNANTTYYTIVDASTGAWEVGLGTYTSAGTTLSRDTVLESSNSGSLVNFGAGTKDVFVTYPAERAVVSGTTDYLSLPAPSTSGNVLTSNGSAWTSSAPAGGSTFTINNKTGAYTVVSSDAGKVINCTANSFTVSLTDVATIGVGFSCWIWNTSGSAADLITIDPYLSQTIDGVSQLVLSPGEGVQIVNDGSVWSTAAGKKLRGYAENFLASLTIRPSATGTYSAAIGYGATASGVGSFAAAGLSALASGTQSVAIGGGTQASSLSSTAIGRNSANAGSQAVSGSGAVAIGGSYTSGNDGFSAAIGSNSSSYGAKGASSIAMGRIALASANYSVAIGSTSGGSGAQAVGIGSVALGGSYAYGTNSFAASIGDNSSAYGAYGVNGVAIGYRANTNNDYSTAIGTNASANADYSMAIGYGARTHVIGKYVYAGGFFAAVGDAQTGATVLRGATTTATPVVLTTNGSAGGTTNQVNLVNTSALAFSGLIVARQQSAGGTASAGWRVEGLIRREGTAGSTVLVNSAVTVLDNTPGWAIALTADTVNGALAVTATGAAATNIRWVATITTSEVTYA